MSRTEHRPAHLPARILGGLGLAVVVIVVGGLVLREHAPGNMGNGFIGGGLFALAAASFAAWRSLRRPDSATSFERAFTQAGDERDDAVLTQALAVLGVCALPLTGVAACAIALGAEQSMVLALLVLGQLAIGVVSYLVVNRRS